MVGDSLLKDGDPHSNFLSGVTDPRSDEYVVCHDCSGAGWGGHKTGDGLNAPNRINTIAE